MSYANHFRLMNHNRLYRLSGLKMLQLLFLFSFLPYLLLGCSFEDKSILYSRAADRAAEDFVKELKEEKRCSGINRIAVFGIEKDSGEFMRSALNSKLISDTKYQVLGVQGQKEMDKVMKAHGMMLKYQDRYDENTLIALGNLIHYRHAINGRLVALKRGPNAAKVDFRGQILDLESGDMIFEKPSTGCFHRKLGLSDWAVNIAVASGLFFLLFFLSRGNYFCGEPAKQIFLWFMVITMWGLAVFLYYIWPI